MRDQHFKKTPDTNFYRYEWLFSSCIYIYVIEDSSFEENIDHQFIIKCAGHSTKFDNFLEMQSRFFYTIFFFNEIKFVSDKKKWKVNYIL